MIRSMVFKLQMTARHGRSFETAMQQLNDLYNAALQERKDAWSKSKTSISKFDQFKSLTLIRRENPEFKTYAATMQRTALVQVDEAFKGFFARLKKGGIAGFPRFRSIKRVRSFGFTEAIGWTLKSNLLAMKGLPKIKLKMHRQLIGKPLKLLIKKRATGWVAIIVVRQASMFGPVVPGAKGYDLGVSDIITDSDGTGYGRINAERANAAERLKYEHALARQKRGSRRWRQSQKRLARQRHREACQRRTGYFQKAAQIVRSAAGILILEKLQVKNMTRSARGTVEQPGKNVAAKSGLNRSLADTGISQFTKILVDKAASAGRLVVFVNPKNTSQDCSSCGVRVKKTLRHRRHVCGCGLDIGRDHNAAINILHRGVVAAEQIRLAA